MKDCIKRIKALTIRNVKEIIRDPLSLIFLFLVPIAMLILFYSLFHKLTPQFEIKYLAPSMVAFGHAFIALFAGILIATDRNTTFLTRLYTTKTKSFEFIFGYTLALIPIGLLQSISLFVIAIIIDSSFCCLNLLIALPLTLFTALLFIGFGILIGSFCNEKSVGGIASIVIMAQSILSGMWFPLEGLSESFIRVLEILPFRSSSLLFQNIILGVSEDILSSLSILLIYSLLIYGLAIFIFNLKMRKR